MTRTRFESVAEYLAAQPAAVRAALRRVRATLQRALPEAEERISYQILVFELDGRAVFHVAGWKQHYSLYPASPRVVAALRGARAPHEVRGSTLRFPLDSPVPVTLIARLAKLRAQEAAERSAKKQAKAKKRSGR